jgi:hypothetical protein
MGNDSSNKREIGIIVNTWYSRLLSFPQSLSNLIIFASSQNRGEKELINSAIGREWRWRQSGKLRHGIKRSIQNPQLFENEVFKVGIAVPAPCPMTDCVHAMQ